MWTHRVDTELCQHWDPVSVAQAGALETWKVSNEVSDDRLVRTVSEDSYFVSSRKNTSFQTVKAESHDTLKTE